MSGAAGAPRRGGRMQGEIFWMLATISSVCVGLGKGGLPVIGMLAVPVLALVISPVAAAGLLLPVYVLSDMIGLYNYRRAFDRRVLTIMMTGMTVGVGLGWATARIVSEDLVTLLVGLMGAIFALNLILRHKHDRPAKEARWAGGMFWGTVTGFTSFVSHSGGPPFQVWVLSLKLSKSVFVGTSIIAFSYVNAIKLVPYYFLGQLNPDNLRIAAVLMVPAGLAVIGGVRLVRIIPDQMFFRIVTWALLGISLKLIWDGVTG